MLESFIIQCKIPSTRVARYLLETLNVLDVGMQLENSINNPWLLTLTIVSSDCLIPTHLSKKQGFVSRFHTIYRGKGIALVHDAISVDNDIESSICKKQHLLR